MAFIFGGNTGTSYEDIQRKRRMADAIAASRPGQISNVGEGISSAASSIASALLNRRADKDYAKGKAAFDASFPGALAPTGFTPPKTEAQSLASDTMDALGFGEKNIVAGLTQRGLPEHVAKGFAMNFADESGFNPGINERNPVVPGSRGGFGLAQWTGPRRVALEQFAAAKGASSADPNVQMDFLVQELQGSEAAAAQAIMSAPDERQAAVAVLNKFLRPAEQHRAAREAKYLAGGQPQAGGGMNIAQLAEAAGSPYASPAQQAVAQALLQQQMQAMDPMRRLEMERAGQPDTQYIKGRGLMNMQTGEIISPEPEGMAGSDVTFGVTPQYATDQNGNLTMFVLGDNGEMKEVKLPEGYTPRPGAQIVDTGTAYQPVDKRTGEVAGPAIPKDVAGAAAATAAGKVAGEGQAAAAASLPQAELDAQGAIDLISGIVTDPALSNATGVLQSRLPTTSQKTADVEVRIDSLKNKVFPMAIQALVGLGAMSNMEGQAVAQSVANLDLRQGDKQFREELTRLGDYLAEKLEIHRKKAGVQAAPAARPTDGLTDDDLKWLGD